MWRFKWCLLVGWLRRGCVEVVLLLGQLQRAELGECVLLRELGACSQLGASSSLRLYFTRSLLKRSPFGTVTSIRFTGSSLMCQ